MRFIHLAILTALIVIIGCAANSPLIQASSKGDTLTVQKHLNEGAKINEPDSKGYTPLMHAIWAGNTDLIKLLISKGADVNFRDNYKRTPLIYAVSNDNIAIDIVKLLIEIGADINAKDYYGYTVLMWASSPSIVELLIDKGASVHARNNEGYTVLQYAIYQQNIEKVAIIRKRTNWKETADSLGMYEALKIPSFYKPEQGMFAVSSDKELAYKAAVYDCNQMSITGKTGLVLATGPVGYLAGMAFDSATVQKKFQSCMAIMGFECKNNCSK